MSLGKVLLSVLGISTVAGLSIYGINKAVNSPEKKEDKKDDSVIQTDNPDEVEEELHGEDYKKVSEEDIPKAKEEEKPHTEPKVIKVQLDPDSPIITMNANKEEETKAAKFTIIDGDKKEDKKEEKKSTTTKKATEKKETAKPATKKASTAKKPAAKKATAKSTSEAKKVVEKKTTTKKATTAKKTVEAK
jgi:hypothetical protein